MYKNLKQRKISENSLIESEKRYRQLFENSPVALWEEDFSELYEYFSELEQKGVGDLRDYLEKNPDEIHVCAQKVNVLDVNKATLVMNDAKTKKELLGDIDKTFTEQSINVFKEGVLAVSEGKNYFRSEAHIKTLSGGLKYVDIIYYIEQICNTKIFVSMTDITDKKKAEKELEKYQQYLEKMVDERTKELEEKNRELKQFNKLFVDREFRIHELKERVKQLEKGE
ncbi:MAG: hypothetical protein U9R32_01620 [Bacteroidota bacterium]|nr:hypothetical protein [Bacteroidota bacterium]